MQPKKEKVWSAAAVAPSLSKVVVRCAALWAGTSGDISHYPREAATNLEAPMFSLDKCSPPYCHVRSLDVPMSRRQLFPAFAGAMLVIAAAISLGTSEAAYAQSKTDKKTQSIRTIRTTAKAARSAASSCRQSHASW